jgi:SAM-dependent methyltransferase
MKRRKSTGYDQLRCPYCQEPLHLIQTLAHFPHSPQLRYGILKCLCDEYPIVEGIVYLKKDGAQINQLAVRYLRQGQWQAAFSCLIAERKKIKWLYLLLWRLPPTSRLSQWLTLNHVLKLMYWLVDGASKPWYRYLTTRQNRVTYLLTLAPLALAQSTTTLVDAGCGLGYFLKRATDWTTATKIFGLDISFSFLYLARRFVVTPGTYLVCCDQELGLPFANHSVSHYFINDAFVVIKNKKAVIHELARVVTPTGRAVITHVHNQAVENLGQEYGVTLPEMAHYSPGGTLAASSDLDLWRSATKQQQLVYTPIAQLQRKTTRAKPPAFSFTWSPRRHQQLKQPVLSPWLNLVKNTQIDYSEDEHLRI